MFKCAGCAAKDQEIARLIGEKAELQDRMMTMIGQAYQSQLTTGPTTRAGDGDPEPETEAGQTDEEWASLTLEEAAARLERSGHKIRPDFPT